MDTRQTKKTAEAASKPDDSVLESTGTEVLQAPESAQDKAQEWRTLCKEFDDNINLAINILAIGKKQSAPQLYIYFDKILPILTLWLSSHEAQTPQEDHQLHKEFMRYATYATSNIKAKLHSLKTKGLSADIIFTALDYRSYSSLEQARIDQRHFVVRSGSSEGSQSIRSARSHPASSNSRRSNESRRRNYVPPRGRYRQPRDQRANAHEFVAPYDYAEPDDLLREMSRYHKLPPPWNKVPVQSVRKERLDISRQVQLAGDRQFKGQIDDYFKWRDFFIGTMGDVRCYARHKVNALRRSLEAVLDNVIDYVSGDFDGYREIIINLEKSYGGTFRQMSRYDDYFDATKFKFGNLEKFRDYARKVAGYRALLTSSSDRALFSTPHIYRRLLLPLPNGHVRELQTWLHSGRLNANANNLLLWTRDRLDRLMTEKEVDRSKDKSKQENVKTKKDKPVVMSMITCEDSSEPEEYESNLEEESSDTEITVQYLSTKPPEFCLLSCTTLHDLDKCPSFTKMTPEKRRLMIMQWKVLTCFGCLKFGHTSRNCRTKKGCEVCKSRNHHTLLHRDTATQVSTILNPSLFLTASKLNVGFLPYIRIKVTPPNSCFPFHVNAMIDSGANTSVVSPLFRKCMNVTDPYTKITVNTANGPVEKNTSVVEFMIWPIDLPPVKIVAVSFQNDEIFPHLKVWNTANIMNKHDYLKNLPIQPLEESSVDVLLGNDVPGLTSPIKTLRGDSPFDPVAELSILGWTIRGPDRLCANVTVCDPPPPEQFDLCEPTTLLSFRDLMNRIAMSWAIPERMDGDFIARDDKIANDIIKRSMKLDQGFVTCGILWKEAHAPNILNNRPLAVRRLQSLLTMLRKNDQVCELYKNNIQNWIDEGSLIKVTERAREGRINYLSHFPVIRMTKETTKVRTVVDASARYRGTCLNDYILPGPNLTNDIRRVLLRFRHRRVAVLGDVKSMFTRIKLLPEERSYHRILWGEEESNIEEYEFTRFTFGNTCSPAVAMSASRFLTDLFPTTYSRAKEAIITSTIVDDTLDSVDSGEEAIDLIKQVREIYAKGSMMLHKIGSNDQRVLEAFPETEVSQEVTLSFDSSCQTLPKTLGVKWSPANDQLQFSLDFAAAARSRRQLLSSLARVYDPLGMISPLLIRLKMKIQTTWNKNLDWDSELSTDFLRSWDDTVREISGTIHFDRKLLDQSSEDVQSRTIHVFSDASSEAFGAAAYIKVQYCSGEIKSSLIMSSSRVAPIKYNTIPRLELQAAVEGVHLAEHIVDALKVDPYAIFYWTDSMDVLHWLRSASRTLKVFVASRVAHIQTHTNPDKWNWVPTNQNPADLLSRGMSIASLTNSTLWYHGPVFLQDESQLPATKLNPISESAKKEKKRLKLSVNHVRITRHYWTEKIKRFQSWKKYLRALIFILKRLFPVMDLLERCTLGLYRGVSLLQEELIPAIFNDLRNKKSLSTNHQYAKYRLFFHDDTHALHASGRLSHAEHLNFLTRYPLFIPENTYLATLIIRNAHEEEARHMGGIKSLISIVNAKFAIPSLTVQAKRIIRSCVYCKRLAFRTQCPTTAPMPHFRLPQSQRNEVFETSAMDCMGPLLTQDKTTEKKYILVITCTFYRAVHLELIHSLSSDSFLLAFERFIASRNRPKRVISDNGRNFLGTWNLLEKVFVDLPERLKKRYPLIDWKFNTPLDPHKGGIFERIVGLAKQNLSKLLRNQKTNTEQLSTMIKLAEAALNNRPLTSGQQDLNDDEIITPNHFLRGSKYNTLSPNSKTLNALKTWKQSNTLMNKFWSRFVQQFITDLNIHAKKKTKNIDYYIGQLVLVKDDTKITPKINFPIWPIGKVIEVYPGPDKVIRTVKILYNGKEYLRGTTKIAPLIEFQ